MLIRRFDPTSRGWAEMYLFVLDVHVAFVKKSSLLMFKYSLVV